MLARAIAAGFAVLRSPGSKLLVDVAAVIHTRAKASGDTKSIGILRGLGYVSDE